MMHGIWFSPFRRAVKAGAEHQLLRSPCSSRDRISQSVELLIEVIHLAVLALEEYSSGQPLLLEEWDRKGALEIKGL